MTKIIEAKGKIDRRLGMNLWGRANSPQIKRNSPPGQHGHMGMKKSSIYGTQLKAKQALRLYYYIREQQFKNIFAKAAKLKGDTSENLVGLLESRLDAIVYRLNFAPTIFAARQMVNHSHIKVNGKKVNIPSYTVKPGDIIEVVEKSKQRADLINCLQKMERPVPDYIELTDAKAAQGKFVRVPVLEDVPYPCIMHINLVVEYYS